MQVASLLANWIYVDFTAFCLGCLLVWRYIRFRSNSSRIRLPYPPGPPQKWIIGNLADIPYNDQWTTFNEWSKRYGDIVYVRVLHNHLVILNSVEKAHELFDKRSNLYSSRALIPMLEMMEDIHISSNLPYGDRWRSHRRMIQRFLKEDAAKNYEDFQQQNVHNLLRQLISSPEQFLDHIRHEGVALLMAVIYDYHPTNSDDLYVKIAETAIGNLTAMALPGAYLVNDVPILRFMPEWLPGGGFKTVLRKTQALVNQMRDGTMWTVQKRMDAGDRPNCLAANLLDSCPEDQLIDIKSVCATSYAGGAETLSSTIQAFFYAMVNHYDVQLRAQDEIDRVVGCSRLPSIEDRPSLPYVEAIYRETLRWQPVVPLGVPHYSTDEDIYEGYYLPKDTTLILNVWGITRNPDKYPDPECFNPSRFFEVDGTLNDDDVRYSFGFGRRVCPGRHLASTTVWLTIVSVLAAFNIRRKKDASGNEIPVNSGFTGNALAIHPRPFECDITPRSQMTKGLILDADCKHD